MCLAIPGKIKSIEMKQDGTMQMGRAEIGGIIKQINLELVPGVKVDDYVLIHVGVALQVIDEEEANKTLHFLESTDDLNELFDLSKI